MKTLKRFFPQITAVLFWIATITAIYTYLDAQQLTLPELIDSIQHTFTDHWYGGMLFVLLLTLRPFTLVPTAVFAVLGGSLYGVGWGFIYGIIGTTLSALIPYYAGKLFATEINDNDDAVGVLRRPTQRIARFLRENAFESLVTIRLLQGPHDLVSLVAGNIHMPLRMFMVGMFVGNLAPTYAFSALGASISVDWVGGGYEVNTTLILSSVIVFIVSLLAARLIKVYHNADDDPSAESSINVSTRQTST